MLLNESEQNGINDIGQRVFAESAEFQDINNIFIYAVLSSA